MLYRILVPFVKLALWIFYSEIEVRNGYRLPQKGPAVILANHPNTLLDAWLIGAKVKRPIYYLAKATFFKNSLLRVFLKQLNMIPINRQSDRIIKGVDNEDSFSACYDILEKGEILVVFPEGTSLPERNLRELKTGSARIILGAEKRNNFKLGVDVTAVGLNYSAGHLFRSKVILNVSDPINTKPYLDEAQTDMRSAAKGLTNEVTEKLEKLVITTEEDSSGKILDQILGFSEVYESQFKWHKNFKALDKMEKLQEISNALSLAKIYHPELRESIINKVPSFYYKLNTLGLSIDVLENNPSINVSWRKWLGNLTQLILLFPILLVGFIVTGIPYHFLQIIVPKLTKYQEFYSSLYVPLGIFIFPAWSTVIFWVIHMMIPEITWWYLPAFFLFSFGLGLFTFYASKIWDRTVRIWNLIRLDRKKMTLANYLREDKNEIVKDLNKLRSLMAQQKTSNNE